jgi:hypothetical protein
LDSGNNQLDESNVNWAILQITKQKKSEYLSDGVDNYQMYFEMCDLDGRKVAGAATIPIPDPVEAGKFRTVVLSTLDPFEVVKVLRKAGVEL